jgi:mRNA-degrading endonuclease RelE of RelBE toxin-antitoxin system
LKSVYEKINQEKLLALHRIGFKLVPISEDAVSPTISWTKVFEGGWDESELTRVEFPNVATCFGRTHLKDKDGGELFLNCMDVDSEQVYTRLALTIDEKEKELLTNPFPRGDNRLIVELRGKYRDIYRIRVAKKYRYVYRVDGTKIYSRYIRRKGKDTYTDIS